MNERKQSLVILEAFAVSGVFAFLYMIAGSGEFFDGAKWIRRFLAPSLFCLWAFWRSGWNWHYLAQAPLMMISLCLPYGADDTFWKVILRGFFGLANGGSSGLTLILQKRLGLAIAHICMVTASSIYLGAFNPLPNAMVEMFLIGLIIILIPSMTLIFKK